MYNSVLFSKINEPLSLLADATGPIAIPLTNDYLFRALLQRSNPVLKALICSLLHLKPEQVRSVVITNSIELGKTIDEKTYILDIHVLMNDNTSINLEMQVINEHNWPERSLVYLARSFDSLNKGDAYVQIRPAVQIGILDYTLFPDNPEFYATYYMINEKNHQKYSDKFRLSVLDLTQIHLATNEDRLYGIDQWAAFFKATTWEELKVLAQQDHILGEAAATIYAVSHDENIRLQCQAREDYYRFTRSRELLLLQQTEKAETLARENTQLKNDKQQLSDELTQLCDKNSQLFDKNAELTDKNTQLTDKNTQLTDENIQLLDKNSQLLKFILEKGISVPKELQ